MEAAAWGWWRMRWRASATVVLAAVLAVTAGCGSQEAEPVAEATATPRGAAGPFEWVSVDLGVQMPEAAALGDGFVGSTAEVNRMGTTPAGRR